MGFKFNPFTANFDLVEGQSPYWRDPVATRGDLPSGVPDGAAINVLDEESIFVYDLATDEWHNTRLSLSQFNAAANAAGITIDSLQTANVNDYRVNLHAASSTTPGGVSTVAQNFAGDKTFDDDVTITGDLTVNGTTTTVNSTTLDVTDANITVNNNGNQASANASDAGLTIEMSDATDVVLGYDSTLTSRMKLGDLADEREITTVSHSQTITNKNLKSTTNLITNSSSDSFIRETGNQSTFNIPDSTSDDSFVIENFAQTMINKTMNADNNVFSNFRHGDEVDDPSSSVHGVMGNVVGTTDAQTLTNKTIDADSNTITNIENADIKIGAAIDAAKIHDASVSNTEFGYLNGVTSAIQTQIDGKADQNLGNLTSPTAINQHLLPDADNSKNIGTGGSAFSQGHINNLYANNQLALIFTNGTQVGISLNFVPDDGFRSIGSGSFPFLNVYGKTIQSGTGDDLNIKTADNSTANSAATNNVVIKSGNKTAGTGNSGNITVQPGTSAGGNRGNFQVVDGTEGTVGHILRSVDGGGTTEWSQGANYVTGDLNEVSFNIANNQATFADVTGVLFNNAVTRSAEILYSIVIDATVDLYETGKITAIQRGSDWVISHSTAGDNSQLTFDMTASGQLQYKSANYTGFVSGVLKARAITTSV